jgi:cell wall-associated NlpC family hydrolase
MRTPRPLLLACLIAALPGCASRTPVTHVAAPKQQLAAAPAKVAAPQPSRPEANADNFGGTAMEVVLYALGLLNIDYRFGGANPESGLDCSGMVSYIYRQAAGISLPHNAAQIAQLGREVERQQLEPGDLVFFNTLRRQFSHVGIYIGDDMFLHAPSSGGGVQIVNLKDKYWQQRYNGARRIVPTSEK